MNIAIYTKGGKYINHSDLKSLSLVAHKYGINFFVSGLALSGGECDDIRHGVSAYSSISELPSDISFVMSYGGDGTFLHSLDMARELDVPVLGVNSGRLGFLASVPREGLEEAFSAVIGGEYTIEHRPLIEVESEGLTMGYAFNEFTLQKSELGMIKVTLHINNEYVADYMADGLIVSSPSGSTAYSMSVGGAIIAPECSCYIINPIAPHNLNMRPVVVSDDAHVVLKGEGRNASLLATLDNRSFEVKNNQVFNLKKSSYSVKLIKLNTSSFFRTIREKLLWGIDTREESKG